MVSGGIDCCVYAVQEQLHFVMIEGMLIKILRE